MTGTSAQRPPRQTRSRSVCQGCSDQLQSRSETHGRFSAGDDGVPEPVVGVFILAPAALDVQHEDAEADHQPPGGAEELSHGGGSSQGTRGNGVFGMAPGAAIGIAERRQRRRRFGRDRREGIRERPVEDRIEVGGFVPHDPAQPQRETVEQHGLVGWQRYVHGMYSPLTITARASMIRSDRGKKGRRIRGGGERSAAEDLMTRREESGR